MKLSHEATPKTITAKRRKVREIPGSYLVRVLTLSGHFEQKFGEPFARPGHGAQLPLERVRIGHVDAAARLRQLRQLAQLLDGEGHLRRNETAIDSIETVQEPRPQFPDGRCALHSILN